LNHFKESIREFIVEKPDFAWINHAIQNDEIESFKILKELGANLRHFTNEKRVHSTSSIMSAAFQGKLEVLKILLDEIPDMIDTVSPVNGKHFTPI
jgi:hypothetical protein